LGGVSGHGAKIEPGRSQCPNIILIEVCEICSTLPDLYFVSNIVWSTCSIANLTW
jgi:hypothetical protein